MQFLGRIVDYKVKHCKDLSKVTRVTIETESLVAKELDVLMPDANILVEIKPE